MTNPETIPLHFSDGESNAINVFRCEKQEATVVIIFPALGVKANYYRHYAAALAQKNFHVVTADHRGHGNSSVRASRKSDFGYKEQIETEYEMILKTVKEKFPQSKIIVMGHSIGAQMGAMFVSRNYPQLDGLIINAGCSVYYKGWGTFKGWGVWLFAVFSNFLAQTLGSYPGHKVGFGNVESKGMISDWFHTAMFGNFMAKGSDFDYEKAMSQMPLPVLAMSYKGDASAPPLALKYLTDKFTFATVETHHVKHPEGKKYNHYSWIREPDASMNLVVEWIEKITTNTSL